MEELTAGAATAPLMPGELGVPSKQGLSALKCQQVSVNLVRYVSQLKSPKVMAETMPVCC